MTCSTDYNTSLNCSCAEAARTRSVFLHVSCRYACDPVTGRVGPSLGQEEHPFPPVGRFSREDPFKSTFFCFTSDQGAEVNDSCEVGPSQSWCVMNPVMFDDVLSVTTSCVARAADGDGAAVSGEDPSSWALCDVGKGGQCSRTRTLAVSSDPAGRRLLSDLQ